MCRVHGVKVRLRLAVVAALLRLATAVPSGSVTPAEMTRDGASTGESSIESLERFRRNSDKAKQQPHIIVILADDLGWNDVSFHGANQIPTPNIDALAYNGVILNSHYVSPMCTPSRAAFMTGKYPIHTGMQHSVLLETEPRGLPLKEKLLSEYLQEAGYATHAIGKWHLGFFRSEYTPTYRGFDSHFGYWNGYQDYWSHQVVSTREQFRGLDMRRNTTVTWDHEGKYSTDIFTEEAVRLIDEHDPKAPMFMYMAHLAPHAGNPEDPYQAPDEEIAKFHYIDDPERRTYAAMVSKLDLSVGQVVAALRRRGMLDNSVILFMSDNGAPTMGIHNNRGSNYPLRGIKDSGWEGAVRGVAAIWSPLIEKPRRISNQLISITDWLPTFSSLAGMDISDLGRIDGVNIWEALIADKISPRSEVLINIDDIDNYAAIRRGDFKYVIGHTSSGDEWYGDSGRLGPNDAADITTFDVYPDKVLRSKAGVAISGAITAKQKVAMRQRRETNRSPDNVNQDFNTKMLTASDVTELRRKATVRCTVKKEQQIACKPVESPCLFNIKEDPCEQLNLAAKRPIILATLEQALLKFRVTAIPAANIAVGDSLSDPSLWNGVWVNWRDPKPQTFAAETKEFGVASLFGTSVTIIVVIVGLVIVAVITLVAIKHARGPSFLPEPEHGILHIDDPVPMTTDLTSERRPFHKPKIDMDKNTAIKSVEDLARIIE